MPKLFCCKVSHNPYKEEFVTEIPEKVFQIDGYEVADRLLECILFDVYFDEEGEVIKVEISDEYSRNYLEKNLNSKKWYKAVREYAESILEEGDEVVLPQFIEKKYFKNGINVAYIRN